MLAPAAGDTQPGSAFLSFASASTPPIGSGPVSVLQEFLLNGGAGLAVEALAGVREFVAREYLGRDPLDRLLLLIEDEFAAETGLSRSQFLAWRENPKLARALEACLGEPAAEGASNERLSVLIASHLSEVTAEPAALAERIAAFAWRAAPLTVEGHPEATALLADRIDRLGSQVNSLADLFVARPVGERERLGEALLRGPLTHANAQELVEEAQRLAEANPLAAARAMSEACARLRSAGIESIAESYEERAAELLLAAEQGAEAIVLLTEVSGARLDRGSELAQVTIGRIEKMEAGKPEWLDPLLYALHYWPVDPEGSVAECIRIAGEYSLPAPWLRRVFELALLHGSHEEILVLAAELDADREQLDFRSRLCLAEASAASEGKDDRWQELLSWADSQGEAEVAGTVWQRRGYFLVMRGEVEAAIEAYRRAMAAWSRLADGEEQVAECFYSILNISSRASLLPETELMPLASELRGNSGYPAARAERLEQVGMSQRLAGKLREALFSYSRSLLIHRGGGSFYGVMRLSEALAELHQEAGEPLAALRARLDAGQGKEAAELARECELTQLPTALELNGPGWMRAAEYRVIAEVGEELPFAYVASIVPQILADSRLPFKGFIGPSVPAAARLALAAVAVKIEDSCDRAEALVLLRETFEHSFIENTRAAANALAIGSELGLWDEVDLLVEGTLAEPTQSGLRPGWLAEQAEERPAVAERLRVAAREGSQLALIALASAELENPSSELLSGDRRLVELCEERVTSSGLRSVKRTEPKEGRPQVSVGFGVDLSILGKLGNFCSPERRSQFLAELIQVIESAEEPENHRASAVAALYELTPALGEAEARRLLALLRPLAGGDYPASPWDEDQDHPYSAIRVTMHINGSLQAASLQLAARLASRFPKFAGEWLAPLVLGALVSMLPPVQRAGLLAAAEHPGLVPAVLIEQGLRSERPHVRADALRAWAASGEELPRAEALLVDPAPLVRMVLATSAPQLPDSQRCEILGVLADDPDPLISHRARAALAVGA